MSKLIKNQVGCREKHVLGFIKYTTKSCHMKLLSSQDVCFSVSHLKTQAHQFQLTQNIANHKCGFISRAQNTNHPYHW